MSDSRPETTESHDTRGIGNPDEIAQAAVIQLREAILDILVQCREEDRLIGPKELTERTGLPGGETINNRYWPAWSFFQELVDEGRLIEHPRKGYE